MSMKETIEDYQKVVDDYVKVSDRACDVISAIGNGLESADSEQLSRVTELNDRVMAIFRQGIRLMRSLDSVVTEIALDRNKGLQIQAMISVMKDALSSCVNTDGRGSFMDEIDITDEWLYQFAKILVSHGYTKEAMNTSKIGIQGIMVGHSALDRAALCDMKESHLFAWIRSMLEFYRFVPFEDFRAGYPDSSESEATKKWNEFTYDANRMLENVNFFAKLYSVVFPENEDQFVDISHYEFQPSDVGYEQVIDELRGFNMCHIREYVVGNARKVGLKHEHIEQIRKELFTVQELTYTEAFDKAISGGMPPELFFETFPTEEAYKDQAKSQVKIMQNVIRVLELIVQEMETAPE